MGEKLHSQWKTRIYRYNGWDSTSFAFQRAAITAKKLLFIRNVKVVFHVLFTNNPVKTERLIMVKMYKEENIKV